MTHPIPLALRLLPDNLTASAQPKAKLTRYRRAVNRVGIDD